MATTGKKSLAQNSTAHYPLKETIGIIFPELAGLPTNKAVMDTIMPYSNVLTERWNSSNQTDFSIYSDPLYLYEAFVSFYQVSILCAGKLRKWVNGNGVDPRKYTYFDLYNGIGLGTLHLVQMGYNVSVHNDNPAQIEAMLKLFAHYKLKPPTIVDETWRKNKYDFVSAFEVVEHYKEPIQITKDLLACVNKGGFYVESTGFQVPTYPGHFHTYNVNGETMDGRAASRQVAKTIRDAGFKKIFIGFNKKPRIWRFIDDDKKIAADTEKNFTVRV